MSYAPTPSSLDEFIAAWLAERPDWDEGKLRGALAAVANNGWTRARAFVETTRLVFTDGSSPHDLIVASQRIPRSSGGDLGRGVAAARSALEQHPAREAAP